MFPKKRVIADAGYFSSKWAPVVLRFFQLFIGDQSLAEALTIDTLAEHLRGSGATSDAESTVPLLRRALLKAVAAETAGIQPTDPLVRAVTQLEPTRRAVIVLFRGLSLDLATVAQVTGQERAQVRRVCVDALEELHRRVSSVGSAGPMATDRPTSTLREAE